MVRKSGKKKSAEDEKRSEGTVSDQNADAFTAWSGAKADGKKKGKKSKDKDELSKAEDVFEEEPQLRSETKHSTSSAPTVDSASSKTAAADDDVQNKKEAEAKTGEGEAPKSVENLSSSKGEATGAETAAAKTPKQPAVDSSLPEAAQKDKDSSVTISSDKKADDVVHTGTRDTMQEKEETTPKQPALDSSLPEAAQKDKDSSVASASDRKADNVVSTGTRDTTQEKEETTPKQPALDFSLPGAAQKEKDSSVATASDRKADDVVRTGTRDSTQEKEETTPKQPALDFSLPGAAQKEKDSSVATASDRKADDVVRTGTRDSTQEKEETTPKQPALDFSLPGAAQKEKDSSVATASDRKADDVVRTGTRDSTQEKEETTPKQPTLDFSLPGAAQKDKDSSVANASDKETTPKQPALDSSRGEPAQKDKDSSVATASDKKGDDVVRMATPDSTQEKQETTPLPKTPEELSAAISASAEIPLPADVLEAEKMFLTAENAFIKSKDRAEELLEKSKDRGKDTQAGREAASEAEAATAEAELAESEAQGALKAEVRAFLELVGEGDKKSTSDVVKVDKADAAVGANRKTEARVTEGERLAEDKDGFGGGTDTGAEGAPHKHYGGVEEGEDKESKAAVSPPALKVNPAHLLEYSKGRLSSRESLLAALAIVGLDTPETRAAVQAAEREASEAAERKAAAAGAAAEKEAQKGALTAFQQRTLTKLEGNQQYVLLLHQRMQEEIDALQVKYDRLMEPVFDERARILFAGDGDDQGDQGGSGGKAENDKKDGESDEKEEKSGDTADETTAALLKSKIGTRALPGFWFQAFSNHNLLASLFGQRDKPLFLYLQNVRRVFHLQKTDGFSLIFEFEDNPFFTPRTLTKTFKMKQEEGGDDWVVTCTEGTAINWAEGMDVTRRVIVRKQLNMRTKSERMVKEHVNEKSFFNFFRNSVVPTDQELEAMPEEEQTRLYTHLKTEYDTGVVIRDLIIPYAVHWYLGTATEEERGGGDETETEADTPVARSKSSSSVAGATPADTENTSYSFASWLGF